jgi:hypothetical protein
MNPMHGERNVRFAKNMQHLITSGNLIFHFGFGANTGTELRSGRIQMPVFVTPDYRIQKHIVSSRNATTADG